MAWHDKDSKIDLTALKLFYMQMYVLLMHCAGAQLPVNISTSLGHWYFDYKHFIYYLLVDTMQV